ncbi:MAG: hypothetical protein BAJALOKI2v1_660005 [Promethearchaeota archaeon]|nr:MAG: hypothetical protein BAJALOKI2v1_660005 [Candidatus Lokiarchaeota archaeon]
MPYYVAFDIGHKPRGNIDDNYTELRELLDKNEFECHKFFETSITRESLEPYDILVFACPDFAKITRQEILEIEAWVQNDGGGLLLLSHAGGDKGRSSNLSELSELFGIKFENDQVLDEESNIGLENMPIIENFNPPHPITSGVDSICYRAGCSLTVISNAFAIVSSNETSEPFSTPLICVSEPEKGRIVCDGSYEMFRDRIGGGLQYESHSKLAVNMFEWLISDYRMEKRDQDLLPVPEEGKEASEMEEVQARGSSLDVKSKTQSTENFNISLDISNKSELMTLLNQFLSQINTMKNTIESIIYTFSKSDEISEGNLKSNKENSTTEKSSVSDITKEIEETKKETHRSKKKKPEGEQEELTTSPPKLEEESAEETEEEIIEEEELDLEERREELEAEVEKLERKVKSIVNLLGFLEKKYNSGKMNEKSYKKQSKKLHKDLDKIKRRIEKISNALNQ